MKRILTPSFCIVLAYLGITQASEIPAIHEKSMVDKIIIKPASSLMDRLQKEGIAHGMLNTDTSKGYVGGLQAAGPLFSIMTSDHYLYRVEGNFLTTDTFKENLHSGANNNYEIKKKNLHSDADSDHEIKFALIKLGVTRRNIINPGFILGGYTFVDFPFSELPEATTWMFNHGLEGIWPQLGVSLTGDVVYNPLNLFGSYRQRVYQGSLKLSGVKPSKIELFLAGSCKKYPDHHPSWSITAGFKRTIPIKKWNIQKRFTGGIAGIYHKPHEGHYLLDINNFGISVYIQFNILKSSINNSLKDFLRMPIDRYTAPPYHPSNHPRDRRFHVDYPHDGRKPRSSQSLMRIVEKYSAGPIEMQDNENKGGD